VDEAPKVRSLAVARKQNAAHRRLMVERLIDCETMPCCRRLWGNQTCSHPAKYFVRRVGQFGRRGGFEQRGWVYCWTCLVHALDDMLLAPEEEYLEEERVAFERAAKRARLAAHTGCAGHCAKDPDNLCRQRPVVHCDLHGGELRCARHAVRCRQRHPERLTPALAVVS
jgi:hypothetical protein